MGKTGRDWPEIYTIYGVDDWQTPLFLLIHAIFFSALSVLFLLYFEPICYFLQNFTPLLGLSSARFAAGFTGSVTALSAVCLFFAAGNIFYSSVSLHWDMAQRMVNAVPDWSTVKHALDLGCGRGILLNAVALQLKKSGSLGRVVGLAPAQARITKPTRPETLSTLKTAGIEGVQEYVTCRAGDPRTLPFADDYFDVVVSGVFLHTVGKEFGSKTAAAAAERMRVLGEVVRVLTPGGVGVVWDLVHVSEYVKRLHDLKMEDIRVSERVTAFMVSSHIVSFKKPRHHWIGSHEVRLDWRFNNLGDSENLGNPWIDEGKRILERQRGYHLNHVYREVNKCADWLANHSLTHEVGSVLYDQPPEELQTQLEMDKLGHKTLRVVRIRPQEGM